MIEQGALIEAAELKIEGIKRDDLKPAKEKYDEAETNLLKGKPETVDCEQLFIWDANLVRVHRKDTGELVEERQMTMDDRNEGNNAFDRELDVSLDETTLQP